MVPQTEQDEFIPFPEVCRRVGCTPITLKRACDRHDVPITQLSRTSKRMLSVEAYQQLLSRARNIGNV